MPLIESYMNKMMDKGRCIGKKLKKLQLGTILISLFLLIFIGIAATPARIYPFSKRGTAGGGNSVVTSHSIITGLLTNIDKIKTLSFYMILSERVDENTIHTDSSFIKIQTAPHKVYMKLADGTEIVWSENAYNGNAWVHPNYFPFITMLLDPDGLVMRKNQHHGVASAGYNYFGEIVRQAAAKVGKNFDSHFLYLGEFLYNGTHCYKVVVLDPSFKYIPYTVLKGESVISIARKLCLSEYMIMQHNGLNSFNDISQGQTLMLPTNYGKEITLYIDKTAMLPLLLRVDDEKGLFEQYIFNNVKVNSTISPNEFSKDNKDYHF